MASCVFLSLILFREAPWYFLVWYVQEIITTTKVLLKLSSLCSKQYTDNFYLLPFYNQYHYGELSKFLYLYYHEIHLWSYICCYFTLTGDDSLILNMFYIYLSHNINFYQILNLLFCGIFEHIVFVAVKDIDKLQFLSTTTTNKNQIPIIKSKQPTEYSIVLPKIS